jgi:uncharacterized protein (UPF0303 family)
MVKLAKWLQLPLLLIGASAFAAELEPKTIRDFTPGLYTDADSSIIPDGASQDLQNVDVEDGSIRKRFGSIKVNSSAIGNGQSVRLTHYYVDSSATHWILTISSNTIYKSNDGGATNTVGTSAMGISATTRFQAANGFNNVYFVSESTNVIEFDGSSFSQNTAAPLGSAVAFFAERLWIGQNSILYGSRVADDTDWTDDGIDDADAFQATVHNNDGYPIRAMVPFGPDLLIFKDYSIDRLIINSDGLTFTLVPVISTLGTQFPETVKVADNRVVWLAHDGVYAYNGSTIKRISENVQPTFEGLAQLSASGRSYTETTQAQFVAGTSSGTSATIIADSVLLSTWTDTDTEAADFAAGTLTNVSTSAIPGAITISLSDTDVLNNSFENGTSADADNWTLDDTAVVRRVGVLSVITPKSGSYQMSIKGTSSLGTNQIRVTLENSSYAEIGVSTFPIQTSAYQQYTYAGTAPQLGQMVYLRITAKNLSGGGSFSILSDQFVYSGTPPTFWGVYEVYLGAYYLLVDLVEHGRSSVGTGSFTSQTFDTTLSSPLWLSSTPTYTLNGNTLSFYTQSSTDSVSWDSRVAWTPGSAPTSASKRYVRYQVEFSTGASGSALPFVSDVTLSARSSSGRYKSSHAALTGISGWAVFGANSTTDGGSITYEIYTDTDTTMPLVSGVPTQFVSSQTITVGGTPTISTNTYAVVCATFSITSATQAPQMDDFTIRWSEGDSSLYPVAMFWNQRYYIALAVNSSTENDEIFIYDRNGAWTRYTGIPVGSMTPYRNRPYIGTTDGFIIRINEDGRYKDYDDAAIDAYWISKDFDLGYPVTTKSLVRYYLTGDYDTAGAVTFTYGVERGTLTGTSHDQDDTTGFWRKVIKPTSTTYSEGIQHRFKFANSASDSPMSIISVTGRWNLNTNP